MNNGEQFDEDYFLRGRQSGKSLYENYRWMPKLTTQMVKSIIDHLGIDEGETILDFGCARGYVVKAFRQLGYSAYGVDISKWAIENADREVRSYLSHITGSTTLRTEYVGVDWVVAKDVLEHIPSVTDTIINLMSIARNGVFVVVPLSIEDGSPYVVADYEKDVTHIHRLTLVSWVRLFMRPGWEVIASYRVKGVKDNYAHYPLGNGFIVARRLKE